MSFSASVTPKQRRCGAKAFRACRLADYMYKVACTFSEFYSANPILDKSGSAEVRDSRLLLCECTRMVLEQSFRLMGIEPLERF